MIRFLVRRLGLLVLTLWLMSVAVFTVSELVPGDIAHVVLGQFASPEAIANLHQQLHLNDPAPVRYLHWIGGFVTFQWGTSPSNSNADISSLIPERLGNSLILAGAALLVIVPTSLALGVIAALRRDRATDRLISIGSLSLMAMPEFVTGTLLLYLLGIWSHLLPTDSIAALGINPLLTPSHLVMPALSLGLVYFGYVSRMMRTSTIGVLDSAFVRTAILKGLPWRQVLWRHVVRNALAPTLTVITSQVGYLVGGLVVVERVFNYPGIGSLLLGAGLSHDVPLLEDCVMVTAVLYMLSNLLADLLNVALNPRIRYGTA